MSRNATGHMRVAKGYKDVEKTESIGQDVSTARDVFSCKQAVCAQLTKALTAETSCCVNCSFYVTQTALQHAPPLIVVQIYSERISGTFTDVWQAAASTLYMCTGRRPNRHLYMEAEPRSDTFQRVSGWGGVGGVGG